MASNVLNSPEALKMSVFIVRAFVKQREALAANQAVPRRLAEIDQKLLLHEQAHLWPEANAAAGIATCPLTENGVVRILSHPRYSKAIRITPGEVVRRLDRFCESQDHAFWTDSVPLRDSEVFRVESLLGPRQLTDLYLLALAVKEGGCLATLDEGITPSTVVGAEAERVVAI